MPELATVFRDSGRRLTRQRCLVLEVLRESDDHLDAETVYAQARQRDARISLATVYRTLAVCKELGLVEEHMLGEDHAHFEAVPETPHYHFTCTDCGQVIEFDAPQVTDVVRELCERKALQVTTVHLFLSGHCAQCQETKTRDSQGRERTETVWQSNLKPA